MTTPRKSGLPVFSSSGLGSGGDTSIDSTTTTTLPKLTARKSLIGLRQTSSADADFISSTPKQQSFNETSSSKMKRKLEIGDEVVAEVNGKKFWGVLRHLGPVSFRAGEFAGLELIGESTGKGKNDGSVDGRQYFACEPENGMFCPAAKVKPVSITPATEATARPQSAMSTHSGRSSVTDENNRPPSVTPARPRSSLAHSSIAKASFTPGRPGSRSSIGRPGSALAQTPTAKTTLPRLLPRKSVIEGLADEEGRRRAKTSAEEAEKAEGRITEGSRAHRYLNMSAKDLEARRMKGTNGSGNISPLKETLLSGHRNVPATPKVRTSLGTNGSALPMPSSSSLATVTPKASNKGRFSLFGQNPKSVSKNGKMAPPTTAGPGSPISKVSTLVPPSNSSTNSMPRTPSRLSNASGGTSAAAEEETDKLGAKEKNRSLLEAMALLTPAHKASEISPSIEDLPRMSIDPQTNEIDADNVFSGAGLALVPGDGLEHYESSSDTAIGQAAVPLSLYEESNLEITRLKTQLSQVRQQMQESDEKAKSSQEVELERAKIKAREEERKELEEERKVEKEDEQRRRKSELEAKEKEWKEKADSVQKEMRKLQDEHTRMKSEHEKTKEEFESRLKENETLVEQLKSATSEKSGTVDNESLGQIQAKDLELAQLNDRLQRLESAREQEKVDFLKEIDELKEAGQEALDLYDRERTMSDEQIIDLEEKLHLLEAKAQEAIADAMRERDEALQANVKGNQVNSSSAAEIDQRSLEDQLSQAQSRAMKLEDQLSEANTIMQQEREEHIKRKDKYADFEQKYKEERSKVKQHIKQLENSEAENRLRIDELLEALEESRSALESERSELETLRAEAMIMGEGPDGANVKSLETSRFEVEIERLNGLLEGARSGKREVTRQFEEQRREIKELHALLDEARAHMDQDKHRSKTSNADDIQRLRLALQEQDRELEVLRKSNMPVSEQVESLLQSTNKEIISKEEEIQKLRRKIEDLTNRFNPSSTLGVPPNNRFSVDSIGVGTSITSPIPENENSFSPSMNGLPTSATHSPGLPASKRFSTASTQSRRSYGSGMGGSGITSSEAMTKELSGLRSIVNTLNQELTEVKVTSKQQERELNIQIEKLKNEARRWELMVKGQESGEGSSSSSTSSTNIEEQLKLEIKLQKAEDEVIKLREKVKIVESSKHQEIEKLNKDIAELEALCEATVWRREEQEARRQELERKVAKLQRHLERLQPNGLEGVDSKVLQENQQQNGVKTSKDQSREHSPPSISNGDVKSTKPLSSTPTLDSNNNAAETRPIIEKTLPPIEKESMKIEQTCVECNEAGHTMDDCPYLNDDVLF